MAGPGGSNRPPPPGRSAPRGAVGMAAVTRRADREESVAVSTGLLAEGLFHGVGARGAVSDWTTGLNRGTTTGTGSVCRSSGRSRGPGRHNRALTPRLSPLLTLPERRAGRQRRGRGRRRSPRTQRARPQGAWKTAKNAVSHSAHSRHLHLLQDPKEKTGAGAERVDKCRESIRFRRSLTVPARPPPGRRPRRPPPRDRSRRQPAPRGRLGRHRPVSASHGAEEAARRPARAGQAGHNATWPAGTARLRPSKGAGSATRDASRSPVSQRRVGSLQARNLSLSSRSKWSKMPEDRVLLCHDEQSLPRSLTDAGPVEYGTLEPSRGLRHEARRSAAGPLWRTPA
jgi:hypothetical protein